MSGFPESAVRTRCDLGRHSSDAGLTKSNRVSAIPPEPACTLDDEDGCTSDGASTEESFSSLTGCNEAERLRLDVLLTGGSICAA